MFITFILGRLLVTTLKVNADGSNVGIITVQLLDATTNLRKQFVVSVSCVVSSAIVSRPISIVPSQTCHKPFNLRMMDTQTSHRIENLGISQRLRFERLDELSDITASIKNLLHAIQLIDEEHPTRQAYLSNLGCSQQRRFERLGELSDLNSSISILLLVVQLTDDGLIISLNPWSQPAPSL
jgi:hypothetical protein